MTTIAARVGPPTRLPRRLHADWHALTTPTEPAEPFDPGMVDHLPDPARRWLRHAIAAGTEQRRRVVLRQRKTGWHEEPFTALLDAEDTFDGYTIPTHGTAGWGHGTPRWDSDGAFIQLSIDEATHR
jgi:hypothetical protein